MSEDILERAKAADIDLMASTDWGQLRDLFGELIAEVEAKNDKIAQDAITIQMHHGNVLTLQKEVERLRSEIMQPVETFGTPELVAWIEELHHMVMDFPESERGQIPFVMGMGELLTRGMKSWTAAKDARIDLLDSDQKRYHAAWMAAEEDKEEQAARIRELEAEVEAKNKQIKELQDLIDKPPEEADWVADYHLLQSALDGPIIDAARKWHAAYRKAQNSNLMRAKEVKRLRSANPFDVDISVAMRVFDDHFVYGSGESTKILQELCDGITSMKARIKELEAIREAIILALKRPKTCTTDGLILYITEDIKYLQDQIPYLRRLEAAFLDSLAARLYYEHYPGVSDAYSWHDYPEEACHCMPKEKFREKAREALERIKSNEKL